MTDLDLIINTFAASVFGCCAYYIGASRLSGSQRREIPVPASPERKWFASASAVMCVVFAGLIFKGAQQEPFQICWLPTLLLASLQAIFIGYTLISMANPKYGRVAMVVRQVVPPVVLSLIYIGIYIVYGLPDTSSFAKFAAHLSHPAVIAWLLLALWFVWQCVSYTMLFFRELGEYRERSLNYFSDINEMRFIWIRQMFYFALGVAVLGFASIFTSVTGISFLFRGLLALAYLVFSVRYVRYAYQFPFMETVTMIAEQDASARNNGKIDVARLLEKIEEGDYFYTTPHITIDDVAAMIGVGRTLLSNYLNRELGMNFTTWICSMRVEYAKELMRSNPTLNVGMVSEKVGFSEPTNFVRKFRQFTDCTPLQWKKSQNL